MTAININDIPTADVAAQLKRGDIVLIDVREPAEYAAERISGARNVPLSAFDPERVTHLAHGRHVVLQCGSGKRSRQAAEKLLDAGWTRVDHLVNGLGGWKEEGFPVTAGSGRKVLPLDRQVQLAAGGLVVLGTLLGAFLSPWWLLLSGFVGAGLIFAGATGTCGMARVLAKLPYNQAA